MALMAALTWLDGGGGGGHVAAATVVVSCCGGFVVWRLRQHSHSLTVVHVVVASWCGSHGGTCIA
jgi:hypothetical protein